MKSPQMVLAFTAVAAVFMAAGAADVNMLTCCPGEDTSTEARFVWHSSSDACLLFCAKASEPEKAYTILPYGKTSKPAVFRSENVTYYKYEAKISDLAPDTEYIYWVEAGSEKFPVQRFKSAGTSGSFNFLWMSDVHAHPDNPGKIANANKLYADAVSKTSSSGGIDFILFTGDYVKYGSRYDNWQQWNGSPAMTGNMFALLAGNHEYYYTGGKTNVSGRSETKMWHNKWILACRNDPKNGATGASERLETSYWFIRDGVLFICIDSLADYSAFMSDDIYANAVAYQKEWFRSVVRSQAGKFRYIVAAQHDPWMKKSGTSSISKSDYSKWYALFDECKVDLALSSDDHVYHRSYPLRGDARQSSTRDGTVYMVSPCIDEKNSSTELLGSDAFSGDAAKYLATASESGAFGACQVEVRPEGMKVTYFWDDVSGSYAKKDEFTILPKQRGWEFEKIGERAHKRYRFAVDAPRSDDGCMQISEIQLLDENGDRITSGYTLDYDSTTTDSDGDKYPSEESPEKAADGKTSTKWLDWRAGLKQSAETRAAVWLEFCFSSQRKISGYRWYTADDDSNYPGRTPVSWTLTAYDDNDETCYILDRVRGYDPPKANETLAYPLPASPDEPEEPSGQGGAIAAAAGGVYYALSVGVNNYQNGRQGKLTGCVPDAKNVLSACTNSVKGLWRPQNCRSLCDSEATISGVRAQLQAFAGVAGSGDTVLYYQSSHGGDDCLCLYDKEYYANQFAEDLMRFAAGVRVVVVLDACHSGSMFKGAGEEQETGPWKFAASVRTHMAEMQAVQTKDAKAAAGGPSVGWITACDDDQTSLDVGTGGWFTNPFVQAWKADGTDANGDGYNDFKEMFNIAAPKAVDSERAPQTFNESLLASVAAWEISYHPPASDKWLDESLATRLSTGTWSAPVVYGEDGKAFLDGETVFTPYAASTGNVVAVEVTAQFFEHCEQVAPDAKAQGAVRLGTNGCFQVWTRTGQDGGGEAECGWLDVEADGVSPASGAEYTFRTTIDYSRDAYSVDVKTGSADFARLREKGNLPSSAKTKFPLAFEADCISSVAFVGDTYFTSLCGEGRCEITGFAEHEALILSNNIQIVLDAAQAEWLNNCGGGDKAAVQSAAAGLAKDEIDTAYLLNLDITDGGRAYTFEVTDIDVGETEVAVAVTLRRTGEAGRAINGVLKFYGAATLAAFKAGNSEALSAKKLSGGDFAEDDTATATFQKDGNAFFGAKIEAP